MAEMLLDVRDIAVSFGGLAALDGVSLTVGSGGVVGLIGPNGAGKTTLFNVISGLQRPTRGGVHFAGKDISHVRADRRAKLGIGRNFQNLGLISDETVAVNVMAAQHLGVRYRAGDVLLRPWRWWAEERRLRDRTEAALATFGLAEVAEARVSELSFAAARSVELACVLVEGPKLMLLDEPTTGLDREEIDRLSSVLQAVRTVGTTILVVAHDVRFVMSVCDHIYVLSEGRMLADGAPSVIRTHPAVIEAYLGRSA